MKNQLWRLKYYQMKTFKIIFFLTLFFFSYISSYAFNNDAKLDEITKNLRCLICQGQSIYDSDTEFANSLKLVVEKKITEGMSENEIYEFLKAKYGEWILYDPALNKKTYILWLLPLLLFLIGGAIIFKNLKIKKN